MAGFFISAKGCEKHNEHEVDLTAEQLIAKRLLKELRRAGTVALGAGIPELVKPHLQPSIQVVALRNGTRPKASVDAAVVEAAQISRQGDLCLAPGNDIHELESPEWIVAMRHNGQDGAFKIVETCQLPITRARCVKTIITELGVIEVNDVGLVLKEVAPGVATDEVKKRTGTSLHVADDITVMEL